MTRLGYKPSNQVYFFSWLGNLSVCIKNPNIIQYRQPNLWITILATKSNISYKSGNQNAILFPTNGIQIYYYYTSNQIQYILLIQQPKYNIICNQSNSMFFTSKKIILYYACYYQQPKSNSLATKSNMYYQQLSKSNITGH